MAAVTLTLGLVAEISLSATPNTMQEVIFPKNGRRYLLQFVTTPGKLVLQGGADAVVITTEKKHDVTADQVSELVVPGANGRARNLTDSTRKIWVASATANAVVKITVL